MRKIQRFILSTAFLASLIFLFAPGNFPENPHFQEILNSAPQNEVIIIFNPGGFGNVSLEEAKDFAPIIKGIQETLNKWGLNSIVIPYKRTKDDFFGKIVALRETSRSFQSQAEILSKEIEESLRQNPSKKIIMAGLSNGAAFAEETMEKISEDLKNNVFAIEIGVPFWKKPLNSENILRLDNEGKDSLAKGKMKILISSLLKTPLKWILAKISDQNLTLSQAIRVPGHEYEWNAVSPEITSFLENKFIPF